MTTCEVSPYGRGVLAEFLHCEIGRVIRQDTIDEEQFERLESLCRRAEDCDCELNQPATIGERTAIVEEFTAEERRDYRRFRTDYDYRQQRLRTREIGSLQTTIKQFHDAEKHREVFQVCGSDFAEMLRMMRRRIRRAALIGNHDILEVHGELRCASDLYAKFRAAAVPRKLFTGDPVQLIVDEEVPDPNRPGYVVVKLLEHPWIYFCRVKVVEDRSLQSGMAQIDADLDGLDSSIHKLSALEAQDA